MVFNRKIIILSGIIAALIISYALGSYYSAANIAMRKTKEMVFDEKNREKITTIIIDSLQGDINVGTIDMDVENYIVLEKDDETWTVDFGGKKYPAADDKVENMLDSIFRLNKYQIAGRNKTSWGKFELDEGQYRKITMQNKNKDLLYALYHGKEGPVIGKGEYIRTSFADEVYLIDGSIKRFFIRDNDYWSNLRILPEEISSSSIMKVSIVADIEIDGHLIKGNLNIAKETTASGYEWKNLKGLEEIDYSNADSLLNNIASLTGLGFSDKVIDRSDAVIEIETSNLGRIIIDIQKISDDLHVKIRGGEFTYRIENYKIDRIADTIANIYRSN